MKKQSKVLIGLTIVLSIVSFTSCNNASFGNLDNNEASSSNIIQAHHNAINRLGKSNFILDENENARFYDGQIMDKPFFNYYNNIVFKSSLVEYTEFNADVENYIKKQEDNCWLNHQYDINYDKAKTYVEFSSFIDTDNSEVVMCQVRIIPGNWEDIYNEKKNQGKETWYGKSVMLSPDYTIDVHKNLNIITNKREVYKYKYAKSEDSENSEDSVEVKTPAKIYTSLNDYDGPIGNKDLILKLGEFNKMFANEVKDVSSNGRWCNNQIITNRIEGKTVSFEGNIVEYNSLNPKLVEYLKNMNVDSIATTNQGYQNYTYDPTKKYIEVGCFYDIETNEALQWELFIPEGNFYGDDHKVKVIYLYSNQIK